MGQSRVIPLSTTVRLPLPRPSFSVELMSSAATTFNAQMALTALSTYGKISSHRARVFARLAMDLVDLLSPAHSSTMQIVSRKGKARASDASLAIYRAKKLWLGERSISFHRGAVGIVIIWDIVPDDLGFAGSKLSIASSLPQHCTPSPFPFSPGFDCLGSLTDRRVGFRRTRCSVWVRGNF